MLFRSMDDVETAYYLRMQALDKPGVMANVASILGAQQISIEAIIQKEPVDNSTFANIIMLTHQVQEKQMNQAIAEIESLETIDGQVKRIRMETLN